MSFPLARLAKGHGKAGKGNSRGSPLPVEIVRGGHPARVCENVGEGVTPVAPERERERVTNYLELPNNPTTNLQEKLLFPALRLYLYYIRESAVADDASPMYSNSFNL